MRKYIGHRLVARPELDNTFWTDSAVKIKNERNLVTPVYVKEYKLIVDI